MFHLQLPLVGKSFAFKKSFFITNYCYDTHHKNRWCYDLWQNLLKTIEPQSKKTNSGISIENPNQVDYLPEGYMTIEEFRKVAMEDTLKFCRENGISK